jgi:hypothetical protein
MCDAVFCTVATSIGPRTAAFQALLELSRAKAEPSSLGPCSDAGVTSGRATLRQLYLASHAGAARQEDHQVQLGGANALQRL